MSYNNTIPLETEIELSENDLDKIQAGGFYTLVSKFGETKIQIEFKIVSYTINPNSLRLKNARR